MVYEDMMDRNLHIGFTIEEAYEAFHKGYKPEYVRESWKYLCKLLGWEYRPNKRNGRSREEHLEIMNTLRIARKELEKRKYLPQILELRHKGLFQRQISRLLGIPQQTISDWLKNI